jgi:hypothetical protein
LPPELAAGPVVELWGPPWSECPPWLKDPEGRESWRRNTALRAWVNAGSRWSVEAGLGPNGWREHLSAEVVEAQSARGRARRLAAERNPS